MRRALLSIVSMACITLGFVYSEHAQAETLLFASNSPWNLAIAANESAASFGDNPIKAFKKAGGTVTLNLDSWTPVVLTADNTTPRFNIFWSNNKWSLPNVPIPPTIFPALTYLLTKNDTDRSICINDQADNILYTFWNATANPSLSGSINVGAGGTFSPTGSGWWDDTKGPWAGRASGASNCGGLITAAEFQNGLISHALAAGWSHMMIRSNATEEAVVYPATSTDGGGTDLNAALPMGTRLQLDPTLTDAHLKKLGLKSGDLIIAHAMQKYGVYIVDSSGGFSVYFASGLGQGTTIYPEVTTQWPADIMNHFSATVPPPATVPLETWAHHLGS